MNPRERILAMGLIGVLVLVGGYFALFKPFYLDAQKERDATIARLEKEIDDKTKRVQQIQADQPKLERWRQLSLPNVPSDPDLPRREYEKILNELFRKSGFQPTGVRVAAEPADANSSPKLGPKKEPIYTLLPYKIVAHGELSNLVEMMDRFYRTGLLHRIKNLSIQRPLTTTGQQQTGELDINLTVEAVILTGADSRSLLLPNISRRLLTIDVVTALCGGPAMVALVPWAVGPAGVLGPRILAQPGRNYEAIASKNIFMGPTLTTRDRTKEVEVTRFVYLTDISRDPRYCQALLYDRYNNDVVRLRAETGWDSFRYVGNEGETVVRGKVIRIEERDVIFRVDENYYSIHVGQSLQDALDPANRLSGERLKELGIAAAPTEDKLTSGQ